MHVPYLCTPRRRTGLEGLVRSTLYIYPDQGIDIQFQNAHWATAWCDPQVKSHETVPLKQDEDH